MSVMLIERRTKSSVLEGRVGVKLLGGFEIRSAGRVYGFDKRKACAILAYLLLSDQQRETRAAWPSECDRSAS